MERRSLGFVLSSILVLSSLVVGSCSDAARLEEPSLVESTRQPISDAEVANAVKAAVFDAMCACQGKLIRADYQIANVESGWNAFAQEDPLLASYVGEGKADTCVSGTFDGVGPETFVDDALQNHCIDSVPLESNVPASGHLKRGYCRANFNYCIGSELRLATEAFTSTPSHPEIFAALTAEARRRFQAASVEYAYTVGFYQTICVRPETLATGVEHPVFPQHAAVCTTMSGTQLPAVIGSRLGDAVVQVQDLLASEIRTRLAIADAMTVGTSVSPSAYADAIWGPRGARSRAAAAIMGDVGDDVVFGNSTRMQLYDASSGASSSIDFGYSTPFGPRTKAVDVAELLERYAIPVGIGERVRPGGSGPTDLERKFPADGTDETLVTRAFNLLDHRIAATEGRAPYDTECGETDTACITARTRLVTLQPLTATEFAAYGTSAKQLDPAISPLRSIYRLTIDDLRDGLRLVRARLTTFGGRPTFATAVDAATTATEDPRTWKQVSLRIHELTPRSPLAFAAALSREQPATLSFDATENYGAYATNPRYPNFAEATGPVATFVSNTILGFLFVDGSGAKSPFNWYSIEQAHLGRLGASGALQHLRVHLRRLTSPTAAFPAVRTSLTHSLSVVEASIGKTWSEWNSASGTVCTDNNPTVGSSHVYGSTPSVVGQPDDALYPGTTLAIKPCQGIEAKDQARLINGMAARGAYWSHFVPIDEAGDYASGTFVLAGTDEQARCLVDLDPQTSAPSCSSSNVLATAFNVTRADQRTISMHRIRASFALPRDPSSPGNVPGAGPPSVLGTRPYERASSRFYVLWRTGSTEATYRYKLMDVVDRDERVAIHAFGGDFGAQFAKLVQQDVNDPGTPMNNSLGMSNRFVPPLENELSSNGNGVEDSWSTYLGYARSATTQASTLVSRARADEIEVLQNQRADSLLLQDARAAEQAVLSQACGAGAEDGSCAVDRAAPIALVDLIDIPALGDDPFATPVEGVTETSCEQFLHRFDTDPEGGFDFEGSYRNWDEHLRTHFTLALRCTRYVTLKAIRALQVHDLPLAVVEELQNDGIGTFNQLEGDVREVHVTMFQRIRALERALSNVDNVTYLAIMQLDEAADHMDELSSKKASFRCRMRRIGRWIGIVGGLVASIVGTVVTWGGGTAGLVVMITVTVAAAASEGIQEGVSEASEGSCSEPNKRETLLTGEAAMEQAIVSMQSIEDYLGDAESTIRQLALGDNRLDAIERSVDVAVARRAINESIIATNGLSDTPEWRALQGLNARRAREALYRAQQYAFVARRAIELRLPESMPWMSQTESFTPAPTTWVNDVFVTHLASAAGATWNGSASVSNADHAIEQYVERLSSFVEGYNFPRRIADGSDVQILNLLALTDASLPSPSRLRFHERWAYKCLDNDSALAWSAATSAPNGLADQPCKTRGGVETAEFHFPIDEHDGYVHDRIASGSFNYRHGTFGVNVIGSGVVDCQRATRPAECYRDLNLQVSLEHAGNVEIENYAGERYAFFMEPGVALDARALNAGRTLTNPLSALDADLIRDFERREMWGRPLFGRYKLTIEGRPEIVWSQLADVQLLLRYSYWTRQR